ncbi:E3 ubiquitin-protein ligase SHPRH-like [Bradysia coprophila]|uniref:E3 ubiquitin-protein ligase SHPRH-like n=1 Tax=Bradysia coprophila TaxID=38358 RepID=UPI00187DD2E8|nr:E3 ubiquitin-protein ligase SHPRH-like [Bradysia coprophila]
MTDGIPLFDYYFLNRRECSSSTGISHSVAEDAQRFFAMMREYHLYESRPNPPDTVQDPRMMSQLLDYQKEAVGWMLAREGVLEFCNDDNHSTEQLQKMLSMNINKRVNLKAFGNKCVRDAYYSKTSGCLSWQKQSIEKLPSTGGILTDEMGLGKTIELLSLILLNPRAAMTDPKNETEVGDDSGVKIGSVECTCGTLDPKKGNSVMCSDCGNSQHRRCLGFDETSDVQPGNKYLCPHCIAKSPPKPSKSTLIIVPNSLLMQWEEEIGNNVSDDSLKIHIYGGFNNGKKYVHPAVLSEHDIVLTTYEILRQEIHFADVAEETRLRDRKRYAALPCPLILIEWWRVCLDEAQMVENVNWNYAKLARMVSAINRWCVSGTPIKDGLQDLYGIVCFLDIDPITDIKLWDSLIMEPFRLNNSQVAITTNLFGKIFWRTEKEFVQDQLRLPRQTEVIHRLEFSPAERYFYDQRAVYWIEKFKAAVCNIEPDQSIHTLSTSQLLPFRRLREICTHPQLDEEAFAAVDIFIERGAKLTFNVFELVDWLIKQALMKCQKAFKTQMVALNDLAGLHLMKNELEIAARRYRHAIDLADQNRNLLKTEDIHLLHALINLSDIHKKLRLTPYDTRVNELLANLMQIRTNDITATSNGILHKHRTVNFDVNEGTWWKRTIEYIKCNENATELFQNLVVALKKTIPIEYMTLKKPAIEPLNALITNLQETLKKNLLAISTKREEIFSNWQDLGSMNSIPTYLNWSLLECGHLSQPAPNDGLVSSPSCRLCFFESSLTEYESLLSRPPQESDFVIEEVWMKSWTESILNVICRFAQKSGFPATILDDGKQHIGQFCDLQNEVRDIWEWLNKIDRRTSAMHKYLQEAKPNVVQSLPISTRTHMGSIDQSSQDFKDCLRDLMYLKGLKTYGYSTNSTIVDSNQQKCRVKHSQQKWIFLPCNHFFCANCCAENDSDEFSCSICNRKTEKRLSINVDIQSNSRHSVTNIPSLKITNEVIWRNPFTKVEGVVRTLLTIKRNHPNDKALVICSCAAMLQVFAAEFVQNGISYILYNSKDKGKTKTGTWHRYRTDTTQVLLMPLAVASTGLNLTQANHILLVEPNLNLAMEEQAIGRIHRLGQRKETFVHKFYVADTIEEKLVRMDNNKKVSSFVDGNITVEDLLHLFENNLQSASNSANFFSNSLWSLSGVRF